MSAHEPGEANTLFERHFADRDLDGLVGLHENEAVLPTPRSTATGPDEIRQTLQAYLDSGASVGLGEPLVFRAGDLALVHTACTDRVLVLWSGAAGPVPTRAARP